MRNHLGRRQKIKSIRPDPVQASRSLSLPVRFSRMAIDVHRSKQIVRAMIFFNDMSTLNYINRLLLKDKYLPVDVNGYMGNWQNRVIAITVKESMSLVEGVKRKPRFAGVLEAPEVSSRWDKLSKYLPGGSERSVFLARITNVRDWMGAHVDERQIKEAIELRVSRGGVGSVSTLQLSTDPFCTRFYAADELLNTVTLRQAFGLTGEGDDLLAENDAVVKWFVELAEALQLFLFAFVVECKRQEMI